MEKAEALAEDQTLSAERNLFCMSSSEFLDTSVLTKEEDLGICGEDEEGTAGVGSEICDSYEDRKNYFCNVKTLPRDQEANEFDEIGSGSQKSAFLFFIDSELVGACDKSNTNQGDPSVRTSGRRYSCAHCLAHFKNKPYLRAHLVVHSTERPFACTQCPSKHKSKSDLKSHLTTHSDARPFHCSHCPSRFKNRQNLRSHLLVHSSERPFACPKCNAAFKTKGNLNKHSYVHSNVKPFNCPHCPGMYSEKSALKEHLYVHTGEKPFVCTLCPAKFSQRSSFKYHVACHSKNIQRPTSSGQFSSPGSLKKEEHSEICSDSLTVKMDARNCPVTDGADDTENKTKSIKTGKADALAGDQTSSAEGNLFCRSSEFLDTRVLTKEEALRICGDDEEGSATVGSDICDSHEDREDTFCNVKTLPTDQDADKFDEIGSGSRKTAVSFFIDSEPVIGECDKSDSLQCDPSVRTSGILYSCAHCLSRFKTKQRLQGHMVAHSIERPFACTQCPSRHKTKSDLKSHLTTHSDTKAFCCAHCTARFKTRQRLRSHFVVHSSEKPFACPECNATFKTKSNLIRHSHTHSNVKPFTCPHCSGIYSEKSALNEHLRVHTGEKPFVCTLCPVNFSHRISLKYHVVKE